MNVFLPKPRTALPYGARRILALAIMLVVAAACAGRQTQPPRVFGPMRGEASPDGNDPNVDPADDDVCTSDADCVMTNFTDCCACCECTKPPYAILHKKLHELEARCADTDCALDGCNTKRCPPCTPPSTKAVCDEGSCVER